MITFVNRHYPPNKNVTGENIWDMVKFLQEERGVESHIVHIDRSYTGGGYQREPVGTIHKVKTIYKGDNRILRYLAGMWDGYHLIRRARKINKGPIVVLTSPPLLPMWASIMLREQDWILWSMDLFPEGFGAVNELKTDSWFYKYTFRKTYQNTPRRIIALGENQKRHIEEKYRRELEGVILPCGVFYDQAARNFDTDVPEWKKEKDKIYFGYCGNCGIPHNPAFVKAAIDAVDPQKHRMILVVYGVYANDIKEYARGKQGIVLMDNVPRHELGYIDVHLVTLLPSWTHVAVPSKAVSSICSGASMIFCGSAESDNWALLHDAAWHVNDDDRMSEKVHNLMNSITILDIEQKRKNAIKVSVRLDHLVKESYNIIANWALKSNK